MGERLLLLHSFTPGCFSHHCSLRCPEGASSEVPCTVVGAARIVDIILEVLQAETKRMDKQRLWAAMQDRTPTAAGLPDLGFCLALILR